MSLKWELMWNSIPALLVGAVVTVQLTAISVFFGIILGTIIGTGRLSQLKPVSKVAGAYVDFFRGTPLLVQIFMIYLGLPQFGIRLARWTAAILALSLNSGAYVAEIVRAGVQSIPRGQFEAARSTGMTHWQTMWYIVLPQAFRRIIPPLGNEFVALLKDSSLVAVIALEELVRKGQIIISRTYRPFEVYLVVAVIFLVMTKSISLVVGYAEKKLRVGRA